MADGPLPVPPAEVAIDEDLVARLLADQHPDLAGLPLRMAAQGWDNVLVRVGDDLACRLPLRGAGAVLLEHELRWLPELAPLLPLPVPVPLRRGAPAAGYPWSWSVVPWLPGASAAVVSPEPRQAAGELGAFLAALHRPAPAEAPPNPLRGVPLARRREKLVSGLGRLRPTLDADRALALFDDLAAAPAWSGPPVWLHGDLHPANLVVREDRLVGVLDFGDLTAGDPATDLAVAWVLFLPEEREAFLDAAGPAGADPATRARARAWALALGVAILGGTSDDPTMAAVGRRWVDSAMADHP